MIQLKNLAAGMAAFLLFACSEAPEEKQPEVAAPTAPVSEPEQKEELVAEKRPASKREFDARIEASGAAPWRASSDGVQLTCQRSVMDNPFRAQWFDSKTRIGVIASGFPLDDGSDGTRVDSFRLTSLAGQSITNAEVTHTSLTVREVSDEGRSKVFEVIAKGRIKGGGSFEASGRCRG